jgi:hypothetical protein
VDSEIMAALSVYDAILGITTPSVSGAVLSGGSWKNSWSEVAYFCSVGCGAGDDSGGGDSSTGSLWCSRSRGRRSTLSRRRNAGSRGGSTGSRWGSRSRARRGNLSGRKNVGGRRLLGA